jgi:hypothetical protein
MAERLGKFKLSLAEEKTSVHLITRFRKPDSVRFSFLGFELSHYGLERPKITWGRTDQMTMGLA